MHPLGTDSSCPRPLPNASSSSQQSLSRRKKDTFSSIWGVKIRKAWHNQHEPSSKDVRGQRALGTREETDGESGPRIEGDGRLQWKLLDLAFHHPESLPGCRGHCRSYWD